MGHFKRFSHLWIIELCSWTPLFLGLVYYTFRPVCSCHWALLYFAQYIPFLIISLIIRLLVYWLFAERQLNTAGDVLIPNVLQPSFTATLLCDLMWLYRFYNTLNYTKVTCTSFTSCHTGKNTKISIYVTLFVLKLGCHDKIVCSGTES